MILHPYCVVQWRIILKAWQNGEQVELGSQARVELVIIKYNNNFVSVIKHTKDGLDLKI